MFPHLPIRKVKKETIKINFAEILKDIDKEKRLQFRQYITKESDSLRQDVIDAIVHGYHKRLKAATTFGLSSQALSLEKNKKIIMDYIAAIPRDSTAARAMTPELRKRKELLEQQIKYCTDVLKGYSEREKIEKEAREELAFHQHLFKEFTECEKQLEHESQTLFNSFLSVINPFNHLKAFVIYLKQRINDYPSALHEDVFFAFHLHNVHAVSKPV